METRSRRQGRTGATAGHDMRSRAASVLRVTIVDPPTDGACAAALARGLPGTNVN